MFAKGKTYSNENMENIINRMPARTKNPKLFKKGSSKVYFEQHKNRDSLYVPNAMEFGNRSSIHSS